MGTGGLCGLLPKVSDCVSVPVEFRTLRAAVINFALGLSEPVSLLVPGCPIKLKESKALENGDAALRGALPSAQAVPSGMATCDLSTLNSCFARLWFPSSVKSCSL